MTLLRCPNCPAQIRYNPQFAGHDNMFANTGAICFKCPNHSLPFLANQVGATKVGVIAYGVAQESKDCAAGAGR